MNKSSKILILTIAIATFAGCKRAANSSSTQANAQATPPAAQSASDKAIETEIVTTAPISGVVTATGKILVPEDRTAVIGPVNQGRIVKLYAGQGRTARNEQRIAILESADIDQAEADYLNALAMAEYAKCSP